MVNFIQLFSKIIKQESNLVLNAQRLKILKTQLEPTQLWGRLYAVSLKKRNHDAHLPLKTLNI